MSIHPLSLRHSTLLLLPARLPHSETGNEMMTTTTTEEATGPLEDVDYRKFSYLEDYLFSEVSPRFAETGEISPPDFYMIVIWKANRAKTKVRDRLGRREGGFAGAVQSMAAALCTSTSPKQKLGIVMRDWGFLLPMASAILTVLYPEEFSVYDVRVCDQLERFHELAHRKFSDRLWSDYLEFLAAVTDAGPDGLSLRDKDRYLWGRSFYEGVMKDVRAWPVPPHTRR